MIRKRICLLLCAVLLLGLAACGAAGGTAEPAPAAPAPATAEPSAPAPAPAATEAPAPEPEGISYADAYSRYLAVFGALTDEVERRIETHNAVLENQYPDSYYMNSNYLMQVYIPFRTAYPALGSALTAADPEGALASIRVFYPDAELTVVGPGVYEADYTYVDKTSGEEVARQGRCTWECDGETGAFRVRAYLDGELTEFTEFIPQGENEYLIYTMTDKVLVTCVDSGVTALYHAHRISEPPLGTFPGDMRLCSLEEDDFFPAGTADRAWILEDPDAQYILTLETGDMVFTGRISQDVLDDAGNKVAVLWQDIEPIRLEK